MRRRSRTAIQIALICGIVLLVGTATLLAWLTFPGTPAAARSLRFEGFVSLPAGTHSKTLNILDYLTVNGTRLFVTNVSSGDVYKIDLHDDLLPRATDIAVFASEPGAHGVAIDPASHLAFVTRSGANTVDVFDPGDMKLINRIAVADDPDGIFYDSINRTVYVVSGDAGMATLIDPAKKSVTATIPLGGKPEFAVFDPRSNLLYQNLKDTNSLVALNIANRLIVGRWLLHQCEAPTGIAIDAVHHRLFIACGRTSTLAVFDIGKHQIVASLPIGRGPDSVAFDPALKRIYSTGLTGDLTVIQQDSSDVYHVIDTIHLHFGAHTLAIDLMTHRVFVGYASLFLRPRVAVFGAIQ